MSRALLAAFPAPEGLKAALAEAMEAGDVALDAFTPYPVEGVAAALNGEERRIPWWMLAGGAATAGGLYLMEWFSAAHAYVFNSGGRAPNSWPAFLLAPAEVGVLGAAIAGFVALLFKTGLPRLNHPLFDHPVFERGMQDQFILALAAPEDGKRAGVVRQRLFDGGAVWIEEVSL